MTNDELEIWCKLNECEAVKKVKGEWEIGDHYYSHKDSCVLVLNDDDTDLGIEDFFVPPLFDPIRPERSLIGIVKKLANDPSLPIYKQAELEQNLDFCLDSDRPDLALAKVIIEQEGK